MPNNYPTSSTQKDRAPYESRPHGHMYADDYEDTWVDVAPSSRGSSSSIAICTDNGLEKLMIDAQQPVVCSSQQQLSPKSLQSPNVEFASTLDQVKIKLKQDLLPPGKNSDWMWDWSSRPEIPHTKEWKMRMPPQTSAAAKTGTPPNSRIPSPEFSDSASACALSIRHSSFVRSKLFSVEFLSVLFVTNLFSLLVGAGIGVYVTEKWYMGVQIRYR